jgi:hypothetical protein
VNITVTSGCYCILIILLHSSTDIALPTQSLIALFKDVASTEPNTEMQSTIFKIATQYESFRTHLNTYAECEEQTAMIIDEAKMYIVSPTRVSIHVLRLSNSHIV